MMPRNHHEASSMQDPIAAPDVVSSNYPEYDPGISGPLSLGVLPGFCVS
jgi:hypothetical protein